ncbi:conserved Plasmodium protein, unknown function [Plasmodium ovale]|uniref:6-cysteine protein n=1 Tax=Plasmodium ovale TaxID=36330 RepID=A0A1C3KKC8_PLAOA|nr:conserved Plasmodium protein, unknown function [Plasmodium ovale]
MKYWRLLTPLLLFLYTFHLKRKCCYSHYDIFISNILINNVSFTFQREKYFYELELNEPSTDISISPLLNIWEKYIYKKETLEDELFFSENTLEYVDNSHNVKIDELFLKKYYIYINDKKVHFYDLPYTIPIVHNQKIEVTIIFENSRRYKLKIENNKLSSYFFLNNINIVNKLSNKNLILDREFKNNTYFYSTSVEENVDKLNIQAKCHNSEMYVNNMLIQDEHFVFSLNQDTYNNVLVIECRHQHPLGGNLSVYQNGYSYTKNFIKKLFHENVIRNSNMKDHNGDEYDPPKNGTMQKDPPHNDSTHLLNDIRKNYEKLFHKQNQHETANGDKTRQQLETPKKEIHYNVKNYKPFEGKNVKVKKIFRVFYYFNIFYNITIRMPNFLYNLVDGSMCPLAPKKKEGFITEYICGSFHKDISFYSELNNKLFAFVKVDNHKKVYRFVDKILSGSIEYSTNIYLFLETYYDRHILKIKFKGDTSLFSFWFLFIFALAILFIFVFITLLYVTKK